MNLLLLGGTRFLGFHLVNAARARGHRVTLFHRGSEPAARDVEEIQGDRHRDLAKLHGRRWDVVLDTSGYLPRAVRAAAETLAGAVEQYVFLSSVSAYRDLRETGESAPLDELTAEELEEANAIDVSGAVSAATYGPLYGGLKAACERAVEETFPGRALIVRAGMIVGERDYTDRFTYWVVRAARGGEVLAPGRPERPVQLIDARDLAEWIVAMVERRQSGVFNATGPAEILTMAAMLETCRDATESDARFTWVSEELLREQSVTPWTGLPFWLPDADGLMTVDSGKAEAAGLRHRPLHETVRDVWRWYGQAPHQLRAGLPEDRERELLGMWRGR